MVKKALFKFSTNATAFKRNSSYDLRQSGTVSFSIKLAAGGRRRG